MLEMLFKVDKVISIIFFSDLLKSYDGPLIELTYDSYYFLFLLKIFIVLLLNIVLKFCLC